MSEQAKTLVPKLRFPDFVGSEQWQIKTIDGCLDYLQPTPYLVADTNYSDRYKTPVLTAGKTFILGYTNEINGIFEDKLPVIIFDDFTTASQFVDFPFKAKSSAMKILLPKNGANIKFMYELLQMIQFEVGAHERHWISTFAPMKVLTPKPAEQQKIADCLSSLDDLITAQKQKVEALKQHKKGLIQQLFPAEGETVPKLRFPEFENDGEWVLEEFSKYIVLYRGSSPRPIQSYLTSDSNGINWIKIGDTKNAKNSVLSQVEERITPEGAKHSRKVTIGELILANSMSYGKTYEVAIEGCIYDGWFVLREYENHFDKQFLLQLLNSEYMQNQYQKLSAGGIVQNISSDIVYKTILPCTSLNEQQKIADFLASIDELIAAQTQQHEAYKIHKKGMMQQLLPALEEIKND